MVDFRFISFHEGTLLHDTLISDLYVSDTPLLLKSILNCKKHVKVLNHTKCAVEQTDFHVFHVV